MGTMTIKGKKMRSVDVDWKEFYYTNCPLISASNVDQELGWVKEELKIDAEDTYRGIKDVDLIPSLSPQNLAATEVNKDFMLSHGYIEHDFDVQRWAAPEFLEQAAKELLEQRWEQVTASKLPERSQLRIG